MSYWKLLRNQLIRDILRAGQVELNMNRHPYYSPAVARNIIPKIHMMSMTSIFARSILMLRCRVRLGFSA